MYWLTQILLQSLVSIYRINIVSWQAGKNDEDIRHQTAGLHRVIPFVFGPLPLVFILQRLFMITYVFEMHSVGRAMFPAILSKFLSICKRAGTDRKQEENMLRGDTSVHNFL